jgi:hypothetical protein
LGYVGLLLRRIFGHMKDEETEEFRKLHNEELGCSYRTPSIVKIAGHTKYV